MLPFIRGYPGMKVLPDIHVKQIDIAHMVIAGKVKKAARKTGSVDP
jgi:hypothetical protein